MGIKINAIFLMTILIAGFSSFPSSISSSTEILDQTDSPSLINMAFAASDKEIKAAEKAADKAADKAEKAADKAADKAEKAADKAADKAEKAADKAEIKIQEFDGEVVSYSSSTTICHKPGTPAEKTIVIPENALKGHLGHGDSLGTCAEQIQEFDNGVVIQTSSTTTICHIPPGNPSNAHTITIGVSAVKAHLAHGDLEGTCAENSLEDILSKNTKKPKTCFLFWCW